MREYLFSCLPSRGASRAIAALLAGLALTDRLNSQGARIGPASCPSLGLWLVAAAAGAFLLARPVQRALRPGPLLVSLLALSVCGALLSASRRALFVARSPLQAQVARPDWTTPRLVELPLVLADRRELARLVGSPRHVRFDGGALLYAPETGRYRFELSCDDRCAIAIDQLPLQPISGRGSIVAELGKGYHELRVSYEQSEGPLVFVLGWDRPAVIELIGLLRYVGRDREDLDRSGLPRDHTRAAVLLLAEAVFFLLAFGWLMRAGEHARVHADRTFLWVNAGVTLSAAWLFDRIALPERFVTGALLAGAAVAVWLLQRSTQAVSGDRSRVAIKAYLVIAASAILAVVVDQHVTGVNGPAYWRWPWRRLAASSVYLPMAVPLVTFFAAQRIRGRPSRSSLPLALSLLMATTLALQLVAVGVGRQPFGFQDIARRVMDPGISSFWADAAKIQELRGWLGSYPRLSAELHYHSQNKPPGPILLHRAMQWAFGTGVPGARATGLLIGVLASLSIPASFLLIRLLSGSTDAGFCGASFLALAPGPILFFPELDQVYVVLSCALVGSWSLVMDRRRLLYGIGFGLALSLVLFSAYPLLSLCVFLGLQLLNAVAFERAVSVRFALAATVVGFATVAACYAALFWATAFDPLETLRTALANQARLLPELGRPYPGSIPFDLLDFCMGAGWIGALLIAFFLIDKAQPDAAARCRRVAGFALLQIIGLAATGLVQTETARVWQFLLPLFLCPVGCELASWRAGTRNVVYVCLWFLTATIFRNMLLNR